MKIKLEQEKIKKILLDFYTLTHVRTVIFDGEFNRIAAYPENDCDFCILIKQNPISKELCRMGDEKACAICRENSSLYIYECHAGLIEAVAPVKMNDLTLGYIMFGQVRHVETDMTQILDYASHYTQNQQLLLSSAKKLKVRNDRQISAIAGIMEACASYLWIAELIKIDSGNLIYHLTDYINNNICGDLSVDNLCSVFKISRSRLYDIAHKYYGVCIAKYIRKKRISIAARYLKEQHCPIFEAAKRTGFIDYNYFSKVFKAETGLTPTEYKKTKL